ncbi:ABC transporter ATP-binding protein [Candidatus Woesearchaeota archaeon CG10_big_fil_rev_8_21_14_0_10_45_16]|nr:MAG: ABC transporter ATP-binding protein [Candidatus Woesearchaeota archaeon CG10_big_fil_rev_8_21_14_0_10_45_16]
MKITPIADSIHLVRFRSQEDLGKTFLRFQEHFESPHFRGRYFTIAQFRQWYTSHSPEGKKTGRFTFYQDWGGFNIPSYVLKPFYKGRFNPLTNSEEKLLQQFQKHKQPYYIIGTYGNHTKDILRHEIAHALFYTNKRYRKEALKVIHSLPRESIVQIYRFFARSKGYHHDVWLDEAHAYIMTLKDLLKEEGIDVSPLKEAHKRLNQLFKKHYRET